MLAKGNFTGYKTHMSVRSKVKIEIATLTEMIKRMLSSPEEFIVEVSKKIYQQNILYVI